MSATVHVEGISPKTTEQEVKDFFSFCGKVNSISVTPTSNAADAHKSATVTFEKDTAAKTALLLDGTALGGVTVHVTSAASLDELAGSKATATTTSDELEQEDKPRSRIVAEYLAQGYVIGDKAIEQALSLDQKHGISSRFTSALQTFDSKYKATDRAKGVDAKFGVTDKTYSAYNSLHSYFEKAIGTPTGQRLAKLYDQGNKQVIDVHNEARRLADLKAPPKSTSPPAGTSGAGEKAGAPAPGSSSSAVDPEKAELHYTGVGDKTACNCGGAEGVCACAPGKCSCSSCGKNTGA